MSGMVAAVLSAARSLVGRGGRAPARALVALAVAVLAAGACAPAPTRTLVAPAPVDARLSLYTISSDGALIAYRASDGVKRWTYTPKTRYLCASGGPFYHAGVVFCFTSTADISHPILTAVRATDGRLLWTLPVSGRPPSFAMAGADIVLLVPADNPMISPPSLLVVRIADGVPVRSIPLPAPVIGSLATDGDAVYVCPDNGGLYAYGLSDGAMLWRDQVIPASKLALSSEPADRSCFPRAGEGAVYAWIPIRTPDSPEMQDALIAVRESDGHMLWRRPATSVGAAVSDGFIFSIALRSGASGPDYTQTLVALRATDGVMLWDSDSPGGVTIGGVTEAGGVVAFMQNSTLRAVNAANGAALWQRQASRYRGYGLVGSVSNVVFAVSEAQGSIHDLPPLGTDTNTYLLAMSASDGSLYWQIPLEGLGATLGADT